MAKKKDNNPDTAVRDAANLTDLANLAQTALVLCNSNTAGLETCGDNASAASEQLGISSEYTLVFLPCSHIIGAAS